MVSESNSSLCCVTQELRLMDEVLNVSVKLLNQRRIMDITLDTDSSYCSATKVGLSIPGGLDKVSLLLWIQWASGKKNTDNLYSHLRALQEKSLHHHQLKQ